MFIYYCISNSYQHYLISEKGVELSNFHFTGIYSTIEYVTLYTWKSTAVLTLVLLINLIGFVSAVMSLKLISDGLKWFIIMLYLAVASNVLIIIDVLLIIYFRIANLIYRNEASNKLANADSWMLVKKISFICILFWLIKNLKSPEIKALFQKKSAPVLPETL